MHGYSDCRDGCRGQFGHSYEYSLGCQTRGRFRRFGIPPIWESDLEVLKRFRDDLELHKKEIEREIQHANERIASLEK
jgi:hypothetical protein